MKHVVGIFYNWFNTPVKGLHERFTENKKILKSLNPSYHSETYAKRFQVVVLSYLQRTALP